MRDDVAKAVLIIDTMKDEHGDDPERVANLDHVLAVLHGIEPVEVLASGVRVHGTKSDPQRPWQGAGWRNRTPGEEVPWPASPPDAKLVWGTRPPPHGLPTFGHLHWYDVLGDRAAIPVTTGPDGLYDGENVWHIEVLDGDALRVSPSVHFVGYWHSPNPVDFHRVEALPAT